MPRRSTTPISSRCITIFGEWFDNTGTSALTGGGKWDKLYGLNGNDTLTGRADNDWRHGDGGDDILLKQAA